MLTGLLELQYVFSSLFLHYHVTYLHQQSINGELVLQIKKKLPKVNRLLAARLLEKQEEEEAEKKLDDADMKKKTSKKNKGLSSEILRDERFAAMFENKVQPTTFSSTSILF